MNLNQRYELNATCPFCGHATHLAVAAVSLPNNQLVKCAVCGGAIGTIAELRIPDKTEIARSSGAMR